MTPNPIFYEFGSGPGGDVGYPRHPDLHTPEDCVKLAEKESRRGKGVHKSIYGWDHKDQKKAKKLYGPLVLEFDDANNNQNAFDEAVKAVEYLEQKVDIPHEQLKMYFSGGKSPHIEIPPECFGITDFLPKDELVGKYLSFASCLVKILGLKTLDTQPITHRMIRFPGFKHEGTGLYKIRLTFEELKQGVEKARELAVNPRSLPVADPSVSVRAKALFTGLETKPKYRHEISGKQQPKTKTLEIPNELPTESAKKLLAEPIPEQTYIIDQLVPEIGVSIIGGRRSSLKTWGGMDAAVSVATGTPFLGKYPTHQGGVLYINSENDKPILLNRLHLFEYRLDDGAAERIDFLNFSGFKLDNAAWVQLLELQLKAGKYKLVIIDPFAGAHQVDEDDAQEVRALLTDVLGRLANTYHIAFILIHHIRKGQANNRSRDKMDELRGSSELANYVSSILFFDRNHSVQEEVTIYHLRSRGGTEEKPALFKTTQTDGKFAFEFVEYKEETISKAEECLNEIVASFESEPNFKRKDVVERLDFNTRTIGRALKLGVEKKWLRRPRDDNKSYVVVTGTEGQEGHSLSCPVGHQNPKTGTKPPRYANNEGFSFPVKDDRDKGTTLIGYCPSVPVFTKLLQMLETHPDGEVALDALALNAGVSESEVKTALEALSKSGEVAEVRPGVWRRSP